MNRGLTFIEILVVIAILGVVGTITISSFIKLNERKALEGSAALVTSALDEARTLTLAAKNDLNYGIYFDSTSIVQFSGASYNPTSAGNKTFALHKLVGIREVNLAGGGSSVVFNRLTGKTSNAGSVEIYLLSSPETYRTINVSSTGVASVGAN